MKKPALCLLMIFSLVILLSAAASAYNNAQLDFVTDEAGILTDSERNRLNVRAQEISDEYGCGVYIVIVSDYGDYTDGDVTDCAKSIYLDYTLGYGTDYDGELLLLSMDNRKYALIAYGNFGNASFTDYGKSCLEEEFLDDFANDEWYGGFSDYLEESARYLEMSASGEPFDIYTGDSYNYSQGGGEYSGGRSVSAAKILIIIGVPCIIAAIVCLIFYSRMKTAKKGTTAEAYVSNVRMNVTQDFYTHTTEVRTHIEHDHDSGGSGGGTTVGSDGFSSSSGSF